VPLSPRRKGEAFWREVRTKGWRDRSYGPRPSTQILERPIATEPLHNIAHVNHVPNMVVSRKSPCAPTSMTTPVAGGSCSGLAVPSSDSDQYLLIKLCASNFGRARYGATRIATRSNRGLAS
jgi:hypothetical protein